jgi:hypothetical protein
MPMISIAQRNNAPSVDDIRHDVYEFSLDIDHALQPLFFTQSIGGGHAERGGSFRLGVHELADTPEDWRAHLRLSGCAWVVECLEAMMSSAMPEAEIASANAQAVQRILDARAKEATCERHATTESDAGGTPASTPTAASAAAPSHAAAVAVPDQVEAEPVSGWFAAADEPPQYYVSKADKPGAIAREIATVYATMHARRESDDAGRGNALYFHSDGTQSKLHLYWVDRSKGEPVGDWRYTLVLRDGAFADADAFENTCRRAVGFFVRKHLPDEPRVYFRREFDAFGRRVHASPSAVKRRR